MSADTKNRKRFCLEHIEISVRFQIPLKNCEMGRQIKLQKGMQEVSNWRWIISVSKETYSKSLKTKTTRYGHINEGIAQTEHLKNLSLHYGRKPLYVKIINWFFWYSIYKNFLDFWRAGEVCQKQSDLKLKIKSKLHNTPVSMLVMKLIW